MLAQAARTWSGAVISGTDLRLSLVYLCDNDPADIDNIIKPIQDALVGLVYIDDNIVTDVDSHRRNLTGTFNITHLPLLLVTGIASQQECVYVRVSDSSPLEYYL